MPGQTRPPDGTALGYKRYGKEMAQALELYEKKILRDEEFPIQLFMNRFRKKGRCFAVHWHEHIELHYVVSGQTILKLEQEEILACKGDLVIANSNILHEGFCDGTPMETLVVIFDMADFSRELADKNIIFQPWIRNDPEIDRMMRNIYGEFTRQEIGNRLVCKGYLLQLVAYLVRHYAREMLDKGDSLRRQKKLQRLNSVYQYIESNYSAPIGNRELADLIHVSEGRFYHIFKESAGMAPLQYINEVRLRKAMNLLKQGDYTATEVADAVGFSDYNHFGRLFRRFFGCTPSEVRKNIRT